MEQARALEGLTILVVEDEYFVADDLKHILKKGGAETVRLSGHIDDALEQARVGKFGLALIDINIHGEVSYIVADELRRHRTPFAFVTGYDANTVPPRFANIPLWRKPCDAKTIVTDIHRLLRPI